MNALEGCDATDGEGRVVQQTTALYPWSDDHFAKEELLILVIMFLGKTSETNA